MVKSYLKNIKNDNYITSGYLITLVLNLFFFNPVCMDLYVILMTLIRELYFDIISLSISNLNLLNINSERFSTTHVKKKNANPAVNPETKDTPKPKYIDTSNGRGRIRGSPNKPEMYGGTGHGHGGAKRYRAPGQPDWNLIPVEEPAPADATAKTSNGQNTTDAGSEATNKTARGRRKREEAVADASASTTDKKKVKKVEAWRPKKQQAQPGWVPFPKLIEKSFIPADLWPRIWSHAKEEIRVLLIFFLAMLGFGYPFLPEPAKRSIEKKLLEFKIFAYLVSSFSSGVEEAGKYFSALQVLFEAGLRHGMYYNKRGYIAGQYKLTFARHPSTLETPFFIVMYFKFQFFQLKYPRLAWLISRFFYYCLKALILISKVCTKVRLLFAFTFHVLKIAILIVIILYLIILITGPGSGGGTGFLF